MNLLRPRRNNISRDEPQNVEMIEAPELESESEPIALRVTQQHKGKQSRLRRATASRATSTITSGALEQQQQQQQQSLSPTSSDALRSLSPISVSSSASSDCDNEMQSVGSQPTQRSQAAQSIGQPVHRRTQQRINTLHDAPQSIPNGNHIMQNINQLNAIQQDTPTRSVAKEMNAQEFAKHYESMHNDRYIDPLEMAAEWATYRRNNALRRRLPSASQQNNSNDIRIPSSSLSTSSVEAFQQQNDSQSDQQIELEEQSLDTVLSSQSSSRDLDRQQLQLQLQQQLGDLESIDDIIAIGHEEEEEKEEVVQDLEMPTLSISSDSDGNHEPSANVEWLQQQQQQQQQSISPTSSDAHRSLSPILVLSSASSDSDNETLAAKRIRLEQQQQQQPQTPASVPTQSINESVVHRRTELRSHTLDGPQSIPNSVSVIQQRNVEAVEAVANELGTHLKQFIQNINNIRISSHIKRKVEDLVKKFEQCHVNALQRLRHEFNIADAPTDDQNDEPSTTVARSKRAKRTKSTSNVPTSKPKPAPKKRTTRATSMPNTSNNVNVSDDDDGDDGDDGDEDSERFQSIKMGKRKSFNENLVNKDELSSIINKIVTDMSHNWRLGALNVHCSLMRIIQSNNKDAIRTEFWNTTCEYYRNYFDGYFRGVYGNCINGQTKLRKTWKLDKTISKFCRKHKVVEKNPIGY
ncbi:myb-like protein AA, partial [Contarinia nasturtii]|uniref:myb-like protein AA n=1 Tax=Contarinia nasturtii TaxID=265458 RepID=UPI0012D49292